MATDTEHLDAADVAGQLQHRLNEIDAEVADIEGYIARTFAPRLDRLAEERARTAAHLGRLRRVLAAEGRREDAELPY